MESHRQLVWEHEMTVDGIKFIERKEFKDLQNDKICLVHGRFIGSDHYSVKQLIDKLSGEVKGEDIETNLNSSELENFKQLWESKWHPGLPTLQLEQMDSFVQAVLNKLVEKSNFKAQIE